MIAKGKEFLIDLIERRIVAEKPAILAEKNGVLTLKVRKSATKTTVAQAVKLLYGVEAEKVRLLNVKGKVKRVKRVARKRQDWKKAYVTLAPGAFIEAQGDAPEIGKRGL